MDCKEKWISLMIPAKKHTSSKIWEWSLVLCALDIDHKIINRDGETILLVKKSCVNKALDEILDYEKENIFTYEKPSIGKNTPYSFESSLWILFFIFLFYIITSTSLFPFINLGCAYSWAIYKGEWWRLITSLTLHQDIPHVLSNIFWQGVFIYFLLRNIPPGLTWFLSLLSGILGNLFNYLFQDLNHISLGFSTCVFGSLGIGLGTYLPEHPKKIGIFLMCGLALFAMLGVGGPQVDISNHLFGLISGIFLGLINKKTITYLIKITNPIFFLLFFLIIGFAWYLAVLLGHNYLKL